MENSTNAWTKITPGLVPNDVIREQQKRITFFFIF
jgi:hypothetical protein